MRPKHVAGLIDGDLRQIYASTAVALGINEAHVLHQLDHLLYNVAEADKTYNLVDGKWWVYYTYAEWKDKFFKWMSEPSIKRYFLDLEARGIVLSRQSVKNPSDQTKWYTIDYEAWQKFIQEKPDSQPGEPSDQNDPGSDQNDPIPGSKRSDGSNEIIDKNKEGSAPASGAAPKRRNFTLTLSGKSDPEEGRKEREKTSIGIRLAQELPHYRWSHKLLDKLESPVVTSAGRAESPVDWYTLDDDFKAWVETQIEFWRSRRTPSETPAQAAAILVGLVCRYEIPKAPEKGFFYFKSAQAAKRSVEEAKARAESIQFKEAKPAEKTGKFWIDKDPSVWTQAEFEEYNKMGVDDV